MFVRGPLIATIVLCVPGCGGKSDVVSAAITAGAAVAGAGIYRSATDGCWADCLFGQECDEVSGLCVDSPCNADCSADYECVWLEGQQQCVLPNTAAADELRKVEGGRQTDKETKQWLCLVAGITDCPERTHVGAGGAGGGGAGQGGTGTAGAAGGA
jgi:hypothetical protein